MSEAGSSVPPADGSAPPHKDRHEPRGRKPNDKLPPSRAREVQRAFRLRRAEHLASLEERILQLEQENNQLRTLLALPVADRGKIGSGPTGRGKSLKEGGVPMSERVRARKEARQRERRALGLPDAESSDMDTDDRGGRDSETISPRASAPPSLPPLPPTASQLSNSMAPLFNQTNDVNSAPFNYQLPMPFNLPVSPEPQFPDFTNGLDTSNLYKSTGATPNFSGMFSMFDSPQPVDHTEANRAAAASAAAAAAAQAQKPSPMSPPLTIPAASSPSQPDLLTRLKKCCHVSDSHVVNDPGSLVFATRLCQSFGCSYGGVHTDPHPKSDSEYLVMEDSWKALRMTLDPDGDSDGENRINTGKMAAELVVRAAHQRGQGAWIVCRFKEGLSIKRSMVAALVQGMGGKFD